MVKYRRVKQKKTADLNRQWFVKELLVEFLLRALAQQHCFACTIISNRCFTSHHR